MAAASHQLRLLTRFVTASARMDPLIAAFEKVGTKPLPKNMDGAYDITRLTPERLAQVGELLFGLEWVGPMTRALGVGTRHVQRWRNGQDEIPMWVSSELLVIYQDQEARLVSCAGTLAETLLAAADTLSKLSRLAHKN